MSGEFMTRNFEINSAITRFLEKIRVPQDTKKSSFATVKQATNKKQLKTC
jgi:hypothetical protein